MRIYYFARNCFVAAAMMLLSATASAEFLGGPNGRTADLSRLPDLSLEGMFSTGDFGDADYQNIGLRVNYRLSPGLMLLGDLGQAEVGDADGTGFGLGVFYSLEGLFENMDSVVKGSFHTADFGSNYNKLDILSLEFLVSGLSPLSGNGMMWYANIGLHRADAGSESDTELGLGGGLVLPLSSGEAYVGLDIIDEMIFGVGYRYFYQ